MTSNGNYHAFCSRTSSCKFLGAVSLQSNDPINIVLFGETGVGKSSVINLIAGHQVASVSPDAKGCIFSSKRYSFRVGGRAFRIWDTVGLEKPKMNAVEYVAAIEGTHSLIQQLAKRGGLDLLLFCILGNSITTTTQGNYRLFHGALGRSQVPIALAITCLEREPDMEAWWTRNQANLERCGIEVAGHACVTRLTTHTKYPEAKVNIERMLLGYEGKKKYIMSADSWFIEGLKRELLGVLTKRGKLNPEIAQELAERLAWV
ncbi:P-loop containing nucleoside triphosphate hydrolase protein [Tylopilus felleus]